MIVRLFGALDGPLLFRYVDAGPEIPLEDAICSEIRRGGGEHPAPLAVVPEQPVFHSERLARVEGRFIHAKAFGAVVRVDVLHPSVAELVLERLTDELKPTAVEPVSPLVRPAHPDHHRGVVGERADRRSLACSACRHSDVRERNQSPA